MAFWRKAAQKFRGFFEEEPEGLGEHKDAISMHAGDVLDLAEAVKDTKMSRKLNERVHHMREAVQSVHARVPLTEFHLNALEDMCEVAGRKSKGAKKVAALQEAVIGYRRVLEHSPKPSKVFKRPAPKRRGRPRPAI